MAEPTADARSAGEVLAAALPRLERSVDALVAGGIGAPERERERDEVVAAADDCRRAVWEVARRAPEDAYLTLGAVHRAITETFRIDVAIYLAGRSAEERRAPDEVLLANLPRHVAHLHQLSAALRTEDPRLIDAVRSDSG